MNQNPSRRRRPRAKSDSPRDKLDYYRGEINRTLHEIEMRQRRLKVLYAKIEEVENMLLRLTQTR